MAKRAPIIDDTFNPVASRLERYQKSQERARAEPTPEPTEAQEVGEGRAPEEKVARRSISPVPPAKPPEKLARRVPVEEPVVPEAEPEPELAPVEAMTSSLRARVTKTEAKHYNDLTLWLTGKQNQFSSVARALLLLLEHAQGQGELEKRLSEIQNLERPSPKDRLGMAFYEYRLAEIFWESINAAGKPPRQSAGQ